MSKITRKPIDIKNIKISRTDNLLTLSGPQGEANFKIPERVIIEIKEDLIQVSGSDSCLCGTTKSNLQNVVTGLKEKFKVTLKLAGVGYKVAVEGREIIFSVGYSHDVRVKMPVNVLAVVPKNPTPILEISSIDKISVTTFAGELCRIKKYNPYKQYGILWEGKDYLSKQPRAKR